MLSPSKNDVLHGLDGPEHWAEMHKENSQPQDMCQGLHSLGSSLRDGV